MKRSMFSPKPLGLTVLILAALLFAACQPAATPSNTLQPNTAPLASDTATIPPAATATTASAATSTPAATQTSVLPVTGSTADGPATLAVATHPELGEILVDDEGMTLYMFTKDEPNKSNCSGGCLAAWPPFLTQGEPVAGAGIDETLIGTATMADGSTIVTYNQMPLYYWASDTKPGDATGQGVNDVWYVVDPDGKPVGMPDTSQVDPNATTLNVVKDPKFGEILVDGKGMTLYMFTKDEPDKSNCSGGCLAAWPPFTAAGEVLAGTGVDKAMIGTANMPDGSKIVTYNHMPLYYWAADQKPGDTTGQGVNDVWYVVAPDGEPVGRPQSSADPYGYNE